MVAAAAPPTGMPSREFSAMILGGSWPFTNPEDWQSLAEAQHAKGAALIAAAETLQGEADRVAGEQSGAAIDGYHERLYREAARLADEADQWWFPASRAAKEIGELYSGQREDLDALDRAAHEEIGRIRQTAEHTLGAGQLMWQAIQAVVSAARADAKAIDLKAAGAITKHGAQLGPAPTAPSPPPPTAGDAIPQPLAAGFSGGGGGNPRDGMPAGWHTDQIPQDVPDPPRSGDGVKSQRGGGLGTDADETKGETGKTPTNGAPAPAGSTTAGKGDDSAPAPRDRHGGSLLPSNDGVSAPSTLPASGGPAPTPPSPAGGSVGAGGFKMPSTASAANGLGGGSLPAPSQGVASASGIGGGLPGGAGASAAPLSAPATSSDFSRGLSTGLGAGGGPAAPFAPPVAPASTASGSAAPGGTVASGPASVAAAGGAPPVSTTPAAPAAAGPSSGPVGGGAPSAPVGPLPPFGSDVPRTAAPSAVTPAAGPPAAVTPAAGPPAAGPVASLPPGVVGSGVGASAGAASEGVRSSLPDPLLEKASELVYQLMHASTVHGLFIDWCVGVFHTRSGVETVIVSSEGAGFIPRGVFVPRAARMLFGEPGLSSEFRARWFSWANPASTMVAFADWVRDGAGAELWALAVSTEYGGSAAPAQTAGVPHFEECSSKSTPISPAEPAMPLDDTHMHRLETIDRSLYARLTGFGDGPLPDQSEAWRTTLAAANTVLGRVGALPDLPVPPVIREVIDLMAKGVPVPRARWTALADARWNVVGMGSGLRPGRILGDDAASPHVRSYHDLARLIELLLLWDLDNDADGPAIKHPEIAYLARQIENARRSSDAG